MLKSKYSLSSEKASTSSTHTPIDQRMSAEIREVRKLLTDRSYLTSQDHHVCLNGQKLDNDLVKFHEQAVNNQQIYIKDLKEGRGYGSRRFQPLFILPEQRQKYNSLKKLTKKQCVEKIAELLDTIGDLGLDKERYQDKYKTQLKGKPVAQFQEFCEELQCVIKESTTVTTNEEDNSILQPHSSESKE